MIGEDLVKVDNVLSTVQAGTVKIIIASFEMNLTFILLLLYFWMELLFYRYGGDILGKKYTYKDTMYACFIAYVVQAVLVNLAPLFFVTFQQDFDVTFEQIGRLVLVNFVTQIFTDLAAARWSGKLGYKKGLMLSHVCAAAGLLMMGFLPKVLFAATGSSQAAYGALVASSMIYAIGGGLLEVLISPLIDSLPEDESLTGGVRSAAMSLLHSFYCWGQLAVCLLTTLLMYFTGTGLWWIFPILWALVPLCNLFYLNRVPYVEMITEETSADAMPMRTLFANKLFWLAMVLMIAAGASELAMAQWASLFAEKALGVPKVVGDLLGPCLFAVFMGLGRVGYAKIGNRLDLSNLLMGSALLCIVCYSLAVFVHIPLFSFIGCAVCGLSICLMWPGTLSMTSARFPHGGTPMFAILAVCGDIGCSVGPWLTGIVSDAVCALPGAQAFGAARALTTEQLGLKAGLAAAMIFPVIMLLGVIVLKRFKQTRD